METKKIVCPECNLNMEYWTKSNYINCTKCGEVIAVEPFVEENVIEDENIEKEVTEDD